MRSPSLPLTSKGWLASTALLALMACKREPPPAPVAKPRVAAKVLVKPAPPVSMPDALPPAEAEAHAEAVQASAVVKYRGKRGERLEGDVFHFTLLGSRLCEKDGKVAGVEVEIEAKARLSVSPRDVVIGKGGVTYNASLDVSRKLSGCAPLLPISSLRKGQTARGFVLFDLPSRPGEDLQLIYQPTRWGGAGYVTVPLEQWSEDS